MSARSWPDLPKERPERSRDVLSNAISRLTTLLPRDWAARPTSTSPDASVDALIELTSPDGATAMLALDARLVIESRSVSYVLEDAKRRAAELGEGVEPVVAARYLRANVREKLDQEDVSYIDMTGNVRISINRPSLFIRDRGADKDPWRGPGRPTDSLRGAPSASIIRALVDFAPPISVPGLMRRAGTSSSATYRTVDLLDREDLITRSSKGITEVRWRALIERWSREYGFQRSNPVRLYLEPRGNRALEKNLADASDLRYAVTGSLAAARYAPYAPARLAQLYADEPEVLATRLGLRLVDTGGNVLIARSGYSAVFERLIEADGLSFVAPSQAAVDLLTGPGRAPAEAEALLDWMEANEREWRE